MIKNFILASDTQAGKSGPSHNVIKKYWSDERKMILQKTYPHHNIFIMTQDRNNHNISIYFIFINFYTFMAELRVSS